MISQRTYVVVGAKGGAGATTLALDLADRIPATGGRVLVDADLTGRRSHAVWFDVAKPLDDQRTAGSPGMTNAHGKKLIEFTRCYEDGFAIDPSAVESARALLPVDSMVVVDAPQPFASAVRPFVERAIRIIVVTEPTLFGVAAARSLLLALRRFGISPDRTLVVLNNARATLDFKRAEVEDALDHRVAAELPSRRDRYWNRALDVLARALPTDAPAPIAALKPSASAPVGDRRSVARSSSPTQSLAAPTTKTLSESSPELERLKTELHEKIMSRVDFSVAARAHSDSQKLADLRQQVEAMAETLIAEQSGIASAEEAARIRRQIVDEAVGLGPLESLLEDPDITEIMVNGYQNVYIERRGRIERTAKRFANDRQVRLVIERIIAPLGRRIDEASPMVDARLPDGSRVNAIIEPLTIDGPMLTIRRFGTKRLQMADLVALGSLSEPFAQFLRAAVEARLNVVVSGGTGSGKTTLLNAVSSFIPRAERIVTIEDAAELLLDQPHVVRLESRPANIEGTGAVPIRELVRNALRMRPDRVIIGECRGAEALDMLQAMNTGHDGSLTTVHANSARDAISRVETMVLMSGFDLPIRAIREQFSSAVDVIVQVARLRDGTRRVVSLSEVIGMEGDIVTMQELAAFRQRGVDTKGVVIGAFEATGVQPSCVQRFSEMGIDFDVTSLGAPRTPEVVWAMR
jgi:pilus assembly protein CpaF